MIIDASARLDTQTGRVLANAYLALAPIRPSGLDLWGTAEFLDVLRDQVERGLAAAFVGSQGDVRTSLSDELDAALSGLGLPILGGLTLRIAYARSIADGQMVLDGYEATAAEEVQDLYLTWGRSCNRRSTRPTSFSQRLYHARPFPLPCLTITRSPTRSTRRTGPTPTRRLPWKGASWTDRWFDSTLESPNRFGTPSRICANGKGGPCPPWSNSG